MSGLRAFRYLGAIAATLCLQSPLIAQNAPADGGSDLESLAKAIRSGKDVKFRVRYNSVAPNSPNYQRLFACCGNLAVYMADGEVTLNKSTISFRGRGGVNPFSVTADKVVMLERQPTAGIRLHVKVMTPNKKGKEEATDLYLYNAGAVGSGDGAVGGGGASIECDGCDGSMTTLDLLMGFMRLPQWAAAVAADSASTTQRTPAASGMTNEDVVKLVKAGLSEPVIAASVRQASTPAFDVSMPALIALKNAKVPDGAILAMQERMAGATAAASNATCTVLVNMLYFRGLPQTTEACHGPQGGNAIRTVYRGDGRHAGACRSGHPGAVVFAGLDVAGAAQERGAHGRPGPSGGCALRASIDASPRRRLRVERYGAARGGGARSRAGAEPRRPRPMLLDPR